jgi:calcineurin-like phosphoesterase family protein
MNTFFTSDTHFGHNNVIKHSNRPFSSTEEMDEQLISNWNSIVNRRDIVWHLGDFTLAGEEIAKRYRSRLNGFIHLIWGNHDRNAVRKMAGWKSSQYAADININGKAITLCHYGFRVWNKSHYGSYMFYGHSHGNLPPNNQSLDVGVDSWNYCPASLESIENRLQNLPPYV